MICVLLGQIYLSRLEDVLGIPTLFFVVLHTPSKESQSSTLVITDPLNQKMEHCVIKWENLSFPTDWVMDTPRAPIPRSITSAQIKETSNSAIISFPQRNFSRSPSYTQSTSSFPSSSFCLHASLQSLANQVGKIPFAVKCFDCGELITLSTLSANHNPRTNLPRPISTAKDQCPHPQCSDIPFPHDSHVLVIQDNYCTEINHRKEAYVPSDTRRPSAPEIRKFLSLSKGCTRNTVKSEWMKEMLNWDLFSHPGARDFAKKTLNEEKVRLAQDWKNFMDRENIFISFYEWYYKKDYPTQSWVLAPQKSNAMSCPVQTLSISDLGREINKIKKSMANVSEQKKEEKDESLQVKHQKYHVLIELKIEDLHFRLKTLIDTRSDLNMPNNMLSMYLYGKKLKLWLWD